MRNKYYKLKALKTFFRNGEMIKKGEIVDADEEAKKQLADEEYLMEIVK